MKPFMDQDFLLETDTAKELFHNYASKMPVIDYHCHINPAQIAQNYQFRNITDAWLSGDHYKWRMIRSNGIDERLITGDSTDYEKFQQFAKTLPRAIGNPLYHWTHLELQRYFGITKTLSEKTCDEIWEQCNAMLAQDDFRVQAIIKKSNVKCVATTDDPGDSLEWHQKIRELKDFDCKVIPAWRPDKAMKIEKADFKAYVDHIAALTGSEIKTCQQFFEALDVRMAFFNEQGCKASDHGIDYAYCSTCSEAELEAIFQKGLNNEALTDKEIEIYKTMIMLHLSKGYSKYNWAMQMHYGAIRDPNTAMFKQLGADTGFDCVDNVACAKGISSFMNALSEQGSLPKMIWYSLNPGDNAAIATAIGSFQGTKARGMIQQGSGWWFNDTYQGMVDQMTSLASLSILGNFVGMLTDSRSFLSYTRHEYFRRIMCNLIGNFVERGMYPKDIEFLGQLVQDISFNNTNNYFELGL